MKKNRVIYNLLTGFIVLAMLGCTACRNRVKKETEEKKKLSIYVDIKDRGTLDIIRTFLDEYKKEKSSVELVFNNPLGEKKLDEDIVKGGLDLLFISRDKMMDLSRKGLLSDMGEFLSKNKIKENFYNIVGSYGRIGDKYFGIGLMPNTLEVMYNTDVLSKENIKTPTNFKELMEIIKKLNSSGTKIPVLMGEGLEVKTIPLAMLFSNMADAAKIEESYGSDSKGYSKVDLQPVFNNLNLLVKQGYIKEDTFEAAGEGSIKRLVNGDIPLMLAISSVTKDIQEAENKNKPKDTETTKQPDETEKSGENKEQETSKGKEEQKTEAKPKSKVEVLKNYNFSVTRNHIPVIINTVVSIPANTKNEEAVNDLLEYVYSEKIQKKLITMGYVTGNKNLNKKTWTDAPYKDIAEHLEKADTNSVYFLYDFPEKFQPSLETAAINILKGKYTGNEWKQILSSSNK